MVVEGTLVDSPGQKQSKEVQVQKIQVLGASTEQVLFLILIIIIVY